jgi:lycopene cyclase domain-containing protein
MPPVYPTLSALALLGVIALERFYFRSGIFRSRAYWIARAIVLAFLVPVVGWLTKLSAPIVIYDDDHTSGNRFIWDILTEEFVYAFALLTLVVLCWDRAAER